MTPSTCQRLKCDRPAAFRVVTKWDGGRGAVSTQVDHLCHECEAAMHHLPASNPKCLSLFREPLSQWGGA